MKAIEQYFHVVLKYCYYTALGPSTCKFETVHETLMCESS